MATTKYLDKTGLAYLWSKIKAYIDERPDPQFECTTSEDMYTRLNKLGWWDDVQA